MARQIFVNLPVTDVAAATAFYTAIGFEQNAMFSNEQASAMQWSDMISVMLLGHPFYATFTDKRIIDAKAESGALLCLSFDSRASVDAFAEAALAAGGRELHGAQDQGFMYGRAVEDLDGHGWEAMFMDMAAAQQALAQPADQPAGQPA